MTRDDPMTPMTPMTERRGSARRRTVPVVAVLLAVAVLAVLAACSAEEAPTTAEAPSPSIRTLTPLPPPPEEPPTGRLLADLRQSSRDAALGRFQVWVDNDTTGAIAPTRITYRDPRLRAPLVAGRLRSAPAQAERGYPLALPDRPVCGAAAGAAPGADGGRPLGRLTVRHDGVTESVPVADPADVVGRFVRARCLELAVAEVATLRWADRVVAPSDVPVEVGDTATLTLVAVPTGAAGHELVVETVGGTPILSPADGASAWSPGLRVTGDGRPVRAALPVKPTRCDAHAFLESGGATALRLRVRLDGRPGELVLRMGEAGAAAAIAFAADACGLGDS
ncbi:hypothetical protein GGQ22_07420 [Nocardioides sp. zg-579]|uniref:Uncharacterized protein n=1 Tax=Nocardioides marmotae TaxID=2663857 RepID=A0A6I3J664_9ACTN|nr:hypothetical protein [Nocardioides marmotae]MCR6031274.1 hypothetical protein [Gordonia jinghuaiqii]MTB94912.1 hypothetical protein [Nocardioides marmotae]QKE02576.1 hypothetical protein HPC71_16990 [Nocardioides marmotae]